MCPISLSFYEDPIMLPYGHSFSSEAIEPMRKVKRSWFKCRTPFENSGNFKFKWGEFIDLTSVLTICKYMVLWYLYIPASQYKQWYQWYRVTLKSKEQKKLKTLEF